MSDYVKTTSFGAKDSLATGDSAKLIKGSEFDTEFDDIVTAIATKHDSTNIATQAEAEAGTNNTALQTPLRAEQHVVNYNKEGAGFLFDAHALTDPNGDRIAFWDDTADKVDWLTPTAPVNITSTNLQVSAATASASGVSELATDAEANTGSSTTRVITPANLSQATSLLQATATQKGAVEIATAAEVLTGTDSARSLTPLLLAGSFAGLYKVKTADDTASSDITLSDDTHLTGFALVTGKRYAMEAFLEYDQNVGNFKFALAFSQAPVSGKHFWSAFGSDSSGTQEQDSSTATGTFAFVGLADTASVGVMIRAHFTANASDGGTLALQFAQSVSSANATTLHEGSWMKVTQLD